MSVLPSKIWEETEMRQLIVFLDACQQLFEKTLKELGGISLHSETVSYLNLFTDFNSL